MATLEEIVAYQEREPKLPPITEESLRSAGLLGPDQPFSDALPKRLEAPPEPEPPKK
jgi:hypothetical protein